MQNEMVWARPELADAFRLYGRIARWYAAQIGVSESHLSRVIKGTRPLRREQAEHLSRLLGASLTDCFTLSIHQEGDTDE
jgi:plasmid maintenance system antidote protein VapI